MPDREPDSTDLRVRAILHEGILEAYAGRRPDDALDDPGVDREQLRDPHDYATDDEWSTP